MAKFKLAPVSTRPSLMTGSVSKLVRALLENSSTCDSAFPDTTGASAAADKFTAIVAVCSFVAAGVVPTAPESCVTVVSFRFIGPW